jgi:hypothetical protein
LIPKPLRKAIIKSHIIGLTRASIAVKYKVSTGSVSNIIREYEEALAIVDLTTIRKDLIAISKSGFTIKECAQASQFLNSMKEGYSTKEIKDSEDVQKFLKNTVEYLMDLHSSCIQNSIPPAVIAAWIKDLQDFAPNMNKVSIKPSKLDSEPGIDISPITNTSSLINSNRITKIPFISAVSSYIEDSKQECEKLKHHENTLMESVRRLKSEVNKLQARVKQLYHKEGQAIRYFDWYKKFKAELEKNPTGVQIDDIEQLAKMMKEFEIRGYSANDILGELGELKSC